jgi:hypothetical protein
MDYFDKLKQVGFEVKPVTYTDHFSDQEKNYYRLADKEIIPLVIKPKN